MANHQSTTIAAEALDRATTGQALTNYPAIYQGFLARGIAESDIRPRENVLTYHAWRALGRQVRKGEHGVKVVTFIPSTRKDRDTGEDIKVGLRPWTSTVFHISQTEPMEG
jgi:antirestriction protein ArdC